MRALLRQDLNGTLLTPAWGTIAVVVVLHWIAGSRLQETLWGLHHGGFLPMWGQWALYAGVLFALLLSLSRPAAQAEAAIVRVAARLPALIPYLLVACLGGFAFSSFPLAHQLFGDNRIRVNEVSGVWPMSGRGHEHDTWIRHELYKAANSMWGWDGIQTYAVVSVCYGVIFLVAGLGLARRLGRSEGEVALLFGGLASSGFVLLFFRYLEAYSSVVAVTVLFLWALAAYAQGRCRLWVPCVVLAALGFLHLLALFISPALAYAAVCRYDAFHRVSSRGRGWTVPIVIGASIAAGAVFFRLIRPNSMLPLFSPARNLPYTVVSPDHILTMVNEQLLVALPGLLALAFAIALPKCAREGVSSVDRTLLGVLVVGACVSLGMWAFVNPALGNLDWDLMSMPAPAIVIAGLYFLNLRLRERSGLSHIRVALVAVSLFHTIPWIILQQYPDRAVAALESMVERDVHNFSRGNLGIGMFMEGHREEGRRQLERTRELGVSDKPVVMRWLSRIYIEEERYGAAEQLLVRTLRIIPDKRTIELVRLYRERAPRGGERGR